MKLETKKLSAKQTRKMLVSCEHRLDAEMSRNLLAKVYTLASGQALLVFETGRGLLYESRAAMVSLYRDVEARARRGENELASLLPEGQSFADRVDVLVAELATTLRIEPTALDGSSESLRVVDRSLRRIETQRILAAPLFSALVAYIGEVIRHEVGGRWTMELDSDQQTWFPWIVDAGGDRHSPTRIYKQLLEHGRSASVEAFVKGTLGGRTLHRRTSS